jgi:hypothetical protein
MKFKSELAQEAYNEMRRVAIAGGLTIKESADLKLRAIEVAAKIEIEEMRLAWEACQEGAEAGSIPAEKRYGPPGMVCSVCEEHNCVCVP